MMSKPTTNSRSVARSLVPRVVLAGAICLTTAATVAGARPLPRLVNDLSTAPQSSTPMRMLALGDQLLFHAFDDRHGGELWATDGTTAATHMVVDLYPGVENGVTLRGGWRQLFERVETLAGPRIIFTGNDGVHGDELWITDGTAGGTTLLKDLVPGGGSGNPQRAMRHGQWIYFAAETLYQNRLTVWRTDGTSEGTTLVGQVDGDSQLSGAEVLAVTSTTVFVRTTDEPEDYQVRQRLYGLDLGAGETRLLNINSPPGHQSALAGDSLIFRGSSPDTGDELWSTDGTVVGTGPLADLLPGPDSSWPLSLESIGALALFMAIDPATNRPALWRTDGTAAGTMPIMQVGRVGANTSTMSSAIRVGDHLIFGLNEPAPGRYWISDGSIEGTRPLADGSLRVAATRTYHYQWPEHQLYLLSADGSELFILGRPVSVSAAPQVWRLNGPPAIATGFERVSGVPDIQVPSSLPDGVGKFALLHEGRADRKMVMAAFSPENGIEIQVCEVPPLGIPTRPESTRLLFDVWRANADSGIGRIEPLNGRAAVWMQTPDADLRAPFLTDGSPQTTNIAPYLDDHSGQQFVPVGQLDGLLLVNRSPSTNIPDARPWRTDGTPAGSWALTGPDGAPPGRGWWWTRSGPLTAAGTRAWSYFMTIDVFPQQIWRTDGSANGTHKVWELAADERVRGMADVDGVFHFFTLGDDGRSRLYRTIGSPQSTRVVADLPRGSTPSWWEWHQSASVCALDGKLLFLLRQSGETGTTLWSCDAASGRTRLLRAFEGWPYSGYDYPMVSLPGRGSAVFTIAESGIESLWRTDGTPEGTEWIADSLRADTLVRAGSHAYFPKWNARVQRLELWSTDGTRAGTRAVPRAPSPEYYQQMEMIGVDGRLAYIARDDEHGREVWMVDLPDQPPRLLGEIASGPSDGAIHTLRVVGNRLYLAGRDEVHGLELWMFDLCPGDFDNSGSSNEADVLAYVEAYTSRGDRADANNDSLVTVQDLFDWLHEWFAGCR